MGVWGKRGKFSQKISPFPPDISLFFIKIPLQLFGFAVYLQGRQLIREFIMNDIKCFGAFKRAFRRMAAILFSPFSLSKWIILGFCAWLTIVFNSQGGGIGGGFYFKFSDTSNLPYVVSRVGHFLKDVFLGDVFFVGGICNYFKIEQSVFWFFVFGTAVSVFIMLVVNLILVWVSCRFKFIFIDNIANNSTEIKKPWKKFKKCGNSAFRWLFEFILISVVFMLLMFTITVLEFFPVIEELLRADTVKLWDIFGIVSALNLAVFVVGMVILFFAYYFFNEFVLPIMYKKDLDAKNAYREFLKLFTANPLTFIKFWLLQILANIACGLAVVLFIIITCGIVVFPMLVPYLGALVILPILVFHRAQSMELLAAFGKEYSPYPDSKE